MSQNHSPFKLCAVLVVLVTMFVDCQRAIAQALPPLNLGFTTFKDGGYPAGPGFYTSHYLQQYNSNTLVDSAGNAILPNVKLNSTAVLNQFLWVWDHDLGFGAKPGLDILIPAAAIDLDHTTGGAPFNDGGGIGDILIGPELQFDMITKANGDPLFIHRMEAQIYVPTGEYSSQNDVNVGQNQWSFNPYWAMTLFVTPKFHVSVRPHYLWNSKNSDPSVNLGANNLRVGQAFHTNFAVGYDWTDTLTVGVTGYYLKQTTDHELDGVAVNGVREQVFGIGPGVTWLTKKDATQLFQANLYFESEGENRFEGTSLILRYVFKWGSAEDFTPGMCKRRGHRCDSGGCASY